MITRRRRHWSYAELQILDLLREHPTRRLSYDAMAAILDIDRRILISAMARLQHHHLVRVAQHGRGNQPNCYELSAA